MESGGISLVFSACSQRTSWRSDSFSTVQTHQPRLQNAGQLEVYNIGQTSPPNLEPLVGLFLAAPRPWRQAYSPAGVVTHDDSYWRSTTNILYGFQPCNKRGEDRVDLHRPLHGLQYRQLTLVGAEFQLLLFMPKTYMHASSTYRLRA